MLKSPGRNRQLGQRAVTGWQGGLAGVHTLDGMTDAWREELASQSGTAVQVTLHRIQQRGLNLQSPSIQSSINLSSRACFCLHLPDSHPSSPSTFGPFSCSSLAPQICQDAGFYQTAAAIVGVGVDAAPAVQEDIQRPDWPLHQHHREPEDQRRHQGHLPGLHWQAGNVSRPPRLVLLLVLRHISSRKHLREK